MQTFNTFSASKLLIYTFEIALYSNLKVEHHIKSRVKLLNQDYNLHVWVERASLDYFMDLWDVY